MSQQIITGGGSRDISGSRSGPGGWVSGLAWFVALLMILLLAWVGLQRAGVDFAPRRPAATVGENLLALAPASKEEIPPLPEYHLNQEANALVRFTTLDTIIPDEEPLIKLYTVEAGDSVMGIAKSYGLKPETILWANYDLLQDNPNNLSIGQELKIPPEDGVLYQWKKSDDLEKIAHKFKVKVDDIVTWPGNHIDIAEPQVAAGSFVMVPGGSRELVQWVVPIYWRAKSGANKTVREGCDTSAGTMVGSGSFGWPANQHALSGNDFWSGHLGIDIAALTGDPVYAADSGVVVYAGGVGGGYGLMVMIDHGNGFHTLYAHNSQIVARCGQNIGRGGLIAYAGSTGNSTGSHLHFEIRYGGAFVNPWDYLR